MGEYRLIALDMDGTLLNSEKRITPRTAEALHRASTLGKTVVISTGRCLPELAGYREILSDVPYLICVSGALIYSCREEKPLYSRPLGQDTVRAILEATRGRDIMRHFLGQESIVERDKVPRMDRYHMGVYRPMYEEVTVQVEDLYDYFYRAPLPYEKVNLYHTSARERDISRAALSHLPVEMKDAEGTSLELSARQVDKGTGLLFLCRFLGIDPAETVAVGDAENDREILSAAGLSVAVGNAKESIREMCDVVVPDNGHDGCAAAVEMYLLGGRVYQ